MLVNMLIIRMQRILIQNDMDEFQSLLQHRWAYDAHLLGLGSCENPHLKQGANYLLNHLPEVCS